MTHGSDTIRWLRMLLLVPIAALGVMSIIATGGSSGGGDEEFDPPEIPPTILTSYNFEIGSQVLDFTLDLSVPSLGSVEVAFGNTLRGTINIDVSGTGEVTLINYVTDAGSTVSVTVANAVIPAIDGTYDINVTEALNAGIFNPPDSGAFDVVSSLGPSVTVNIGSTGVTVPGPAGGIFTWDEFLDLADSSDMIAPELRAASLAAGILEFVFDFFLNTADVLDELEMITQSGSIVEQCDMFTGSPPLNVAVEGFGEVAYLGTGDLFPGDSFQWTFSDCWFEDFEELRTGFIQISNYIEQIDASNTLTAIGFAPSGGTNGGVSFIDYTVAETVDNNGVWAIDPTNTLIVNGGFSVLLTAP